MLNFVTDLFSSCRESFVKLNAQLNMRRRQLISELMIIYPIVEVRIINACEL